MPRTSSPLWGQTGHVAVHAAGVVVLICVGYLQVTTGDGGDLRGFHEAWQGGLYDVAWHESGAFVYSPAAGAVIWPFGQMPFQSFAVVWIAGQLVALAWLVGIPMAAVLAVFFQPVVRDLESGNIHIFLAVAVALALRYPAAWAVVLLTKVTPGVGIAYHLGARQWRSLAVATAVTLAIVVVGVAAAPGLWAEWVDLLRAAAGQPPHPNDQLPVPLLARLPIALGVAAVAGWRRWAWAVPLAAVIAMPSVWLSSFSILLASWRLLDREALATIIGPAARNPAQPAADSTTGRGSSGGDPGPASGPSRSVGITSDQE
jgi:hypothetical protein